MLSSGLPPIFLVLTVLELSWSLSDEEKKIIVDEHNRYRSEVSPPAWAMMKMTWDTELEADAQAFAEKCIWEHESGQRGKNLFALAPALDLKHAVAEWNGERKFYDLLTSKCDPGQTCGSYKQVVWAETEYIGCGAKLCDKIEGMETEHVHLLVCKYSPRGNVEGWKPYWKGPPCSRCPKGTVCVDNLCVKQKTDQSTSGAASTCSGLLLFLLPSAILVGLLL